jgi:hypothetical protein
MDKNKISGKFILTTIRRVAIESECTDSVVYAYSTTATRFCNSVGFVTGTSTRDV